VNCYEGKKGARGTGIRVSELVRRVTFFRRQRAMLLGMADDHSSPTQGSSCPRP